MKFYQKIMLGALVVSLVSAGASVLSHDSATVVADPGWWVGIGADLVGLSENGWCSCL